MISQRRDSTPPCRSPRRLVAGNDANGKSIIVFDTTPPAVVHYKAIPGMVTSILWATDPVAMLAQGRMEDPVASLASIHPNQGASLFMTLTLPPDTVYASSDFDPGAAAAEQARHAPGLAERMEPDAPGFHSTDTIDYAILVSGEIWLEVDDGETRLFPGDTVVQLGARHAWRNRSDAPATLAVVMLGAERH